MLAPVHAVCLWNINSPVQVRAREVSIQGSMSYLSWGKGASLSPLCELRPSLEKVETVRCSALLFTEHQLWQGSRWKSFCETDSHWAWFSFPRRRNNTSGAIRVQSLFREMWLFSAIETWFMYSPACSEPRGADGSGQGAAAPVLLHCRLHP